VLGVLDERELIDRAKGADRDAYGELVRRFQDLAFRTAYLVLRDAAEAEDAAQEGFVKAYLAIGRFRDGAPFRPWLLQIVVNEARNRRVAAGRRSYLALRVGAAAADPATGAPGLLGRSGDAAPSPEAAALAAEQRTELLRAVNALREEDRDVIACRYFLDLSEAECAQALGLPKGTVKSRLSRALSRARAILTAPAELLTPPGKEGRHG
jgi:RNA polymerase sigma-70 factor (ECF subfamily)